MHLTVFSIAPGWLSLGSGLAVMADNLVDHKAQELFAELWVKIRRFGQAAQTLYLSAFTIRVGGRQSVLRLVRADGLRNPEPFGQDMHQRGVDIVDALAVSGKNGVFFVL